MSGRIAGENAFAQFGRQRGLLAARVDHQDQHRSPLGAEPVAPYRVLHLEAGMPEANRAGADQDFVGISERPGGSGCWFRR